tara:strand:+ start:637 stop:843 length:207 start_codon:yes stop_codon:yes gene_type:complete
MHSISNSTSHKTLTDFEGSNISEQSRMLATKLSSHMGIENALQVSERNQWHGVVAALNEIKQNQNRRS